MRLRIARTLSMIGFLVLSTSCSNIEPPKVMLTGVEIEGLSVDGLEITLLADVRNPNDFGATIGKLDYRVFVDGVRTGRSFCSTPMSSRTISIVGFSMRISYSSSSNQLRMFRK